MLIGLTGLAGSGKDTVANIITSKYDSWQRYAMASPLKRGLCEMLNIPMSDIEDPTKKNLPNYKFGKSIRLMAQTLGTEWGRVIIADDIWIQMARENLGNMLKSDKPNIVITDIRFDNEADMVHDMGGYVIKIHRPDNPYINSVASNGVNSHASEAGLSIDKIDWNLRNVGSITSLTSNVQYIIEHGEELLKTNIIVGFSINELGTLESIKLEPRDSGYVKSL